MKNKKIFLVSTLAMLTLSLYSCKGDKIPTEGAGTETAETETAAPEEKPLVFAEFTELDLSPEGMPVTIKAPKDAKVIKGSIEGEVYVYGGKRFKLSVKQMSGTAESTVATMKELQADKDLNPSFDKLVEDQPAYYLKASTDGTLSFIYAITTGDESSILVQEGMPHDQSPDQFTDYSNDDVKLMLEAAKTLKAK
ncbi:hypothetical protein OGH69_10090 [Flavobacterium sp. MFBS3-15]|uniref:hypothetical protein n=1 Tax=Flavobacterium sp. MFBS3-15 TaxID=2989816 RepID=UPI0022359863|nr:hypothetical protein [Flavobacterium sp. MFBS3-15]MCW4469315.1 hypothetical protein [Flavobacterium sp. MFBS3-15]